MYSTYKEEKSVVAEKFIETLKNKIFKHMTGISNNVSFQVLDGIFIKSNKTFHKTIKIKNQLRLHLILMMNTIKILMRKVLKLKLVILPEYQNTNTFFVEDTRKIGQKKFLLLVKIRIQFFEHT